MQMTLTICSLLDLILLVLIDCEVTYINRSGRRQNNAQNPYGD